jgi:ATP-binding cassette, subfamily B, bacterial
MLKACLFLAHYLKAFRIQIAITFLSIIVVSCSILGLGYALKYLIDHGFASKNEQSLNYAFLMLIAIIILISLASYSRSYRVNWICEKLEAGIKKDAFKNIINISPSYFEYHKVSDIVSRLTSDLSLVTSSLTTIASYSIRNILMAIGGLIMILVGSLKLATYVLIILPIVIIPIIIVGRRVRILSKDNQRNIADYNGFMEENLSFIKTVQSFNNEEFEINKFGNFLDNALIIAKERIKLRSLFFSITIFLILIAVAFVLWIGGSDVLDGKMSAGDLSSFIFYSVLTATSVGGLSENYSDIQRAIGALERIIETMQAQDNISKADNPVKLKTSEKRNLQIKNLSFFYPSASEIKVLNNLSFEVNANSTIALVGPSGAGKTTIFQLLLRFYDPQQGEIKLGDINTKDFSLSDLRQEFALVSQDPVIFSASAYDNILYGNINASKKQVIEAAKAAEIFDFFHTMPEGLDTYLGEKGMKISGGQKQRIAIARAILRNPKILLLDEATSSLDSENERLVQLALSRLSKNRTTIVIAHRMSTIINADKIILLNKGEIIAEGKHQKLLNSCKLYNQLYSNN